MMLLLTSCGNIAAASGSTITASGSTCTYSGPKQVPTNLSITWDVKDTTPSMDYTFLIVTLSEGKTTADINQFMGVKDAFLNVRTVPERSWMNEIEFTTLIPKTTSETIDLSTNGVYHGEPLYVICLSHTAAFAVVGPIEVQQ